MTETSSPLNEYGPACKLSGTICNLKVTRDSASFFFTRDDQMQMGGVAIAAAIAGLGGPAIASASNASAVDEEADYLEFDLNGQSVKGWVWRNPPFKNGDVVDVAAQFVGDHCAVGHGQRRLLDHHHVVRLAHTRLDGRPIETATIKRTQVDDLGVHAEFLTSDGVAYVVFRPVGAEHRVVAQELRDVALHGIGLGVLRERLGRRPHLDHDAGGACARAADRDVRPGRSQHTRPARSG